jgi:hypothetical protein
MPGSCPGLDLRTSVLATSRPPRVVLPTSRTPSSPATTSARPRELSCQPPAASRRIVHLRDAHRRGALDSGSWSARRSPPHHRPNDRQLREPACRPAGIRSVRHRPRPRSSDSSAHRPSSVPICPLRDERSLAGHRIGHLHDASERWRRPSRGDRNAPDVLGFRRLVLLTEPANERSQRVALRAGFHRTGILHDHGEIDGRVHDDLVFELDLEADR